MPAQHPVPLLLINALSSAESLPAAEPEIRMEGQVVYLGGDPRSPGGGQGSEEGKAASTQCVSEQLPTVGSQA